MTSESSEILDALKTGIAGDQQALSDLWSQHEERLRRVVKLRMDRRLQGRIDVSDVLQEAFVDFATRAEEYVNDPSMPFFLWLRFLCKHRSESAAPFAGRNVQRS